MLFLHIIFPCLGVFRSSSLFLYYRISFVFFLYDRSICTLGSTLSSSLEVSSRLGSGSDVHLTCGPRGGVRVRMEQRSLSKFLSLPGFEPRTSHLAVQHATYRPPPPLLHDTTAEHQLATMPQGIKC